MGFANYYIVSGFLNLSCFIAFIFIKFKNKWIKRVLLRSSIISFLLFLVLSVVAHQRHQTFIEKARIDYVGNYHLSKQRNEKNCILALRDDGRYVIIYELSQDSIIESGI